MSSLQWWHVYLFTRIDSIIVFMVLFSIAITLAACIHACLSMFYDMAYTSIEDKAVRLKLRKQTPYTAATVILLWFSIALIPNQKEAAAIYLLPKIANSSAAKEAEKLPETLVKLIDAKMEEWIDTSIRKKQDAK